MSDFGTLQMGYPQNGLYRISPKPRGGPNLASFYLDISGDSFHPHTPAVVSSTPTPTQMFRLTRDATEPSLITLATERGPDLYVRPETEEKNTRVMIRPQEYTWRLLVDIEAPEPNVYQVLQRDMVQEMSVKTEQLGSEIPVVLEMAIFPPNCKWRFERVGD